MSSMVLWRIMLRITIELVPFGIEDRKRVLHVGEIWNDCSGTKSRGNYKFRLSQRNLTNRTWRKGAVVEFARKRDNAWKLLLLCLQEALTLRENL